MEKVFAGKWDDCEILTKVGEAWTFLSGFNSDILWKGKWKQVAHGMTLKFWPEVVKRGPPINFFVWSQQISAEYFSTDAYRRIPGSLWFRFTWFLKHAIFAAAPSRLKIQTNQQTWAIRIMRKLSLHLKLNSMWKCALCCWIVHCYLWYLTSMWSKAWSQIEVEGWDSKSFNDWWKH